MALGRNVKNCALLCGDSPEIKTEIKEQDERPERRAVDWLKSFKNCTRIAVYYDDETPAARLAVSFKHSRYLSFNKLNKLNLSFSGKFTELKHLKPSKIYEKTADGNWSEYGPATVENNNANGEQLNGKK